MSSPSGMLSDQDYWTVVYGKSKRFLGRSMTPQEKLETIKGLLRRHTVAGPLDSYSNFKDYMQTLCKDFMDISSTPKQQPDRVAKVLKNMHQEHPTLFGQDKSIAAKRLYIMKYLIEKEHGDRRRAYKKLRAESDNDDDTYEDDDEDNHPINNEPRITCSRSDLTLSEKNPTAINCSFEAPSKRRRSLTPVSSEEEVEDIVMQSPPLPVVQPARKTHIPACMRSVVVETPTRGRHPTFSSCTAVQAPRNGSKGTGRVVSDSVHQFLSTCQPPLDHLSIHFAEYGCTTQEHLFTLGTWKNKMRYQRLKDMLKGVTEMEILFLEKHFDSCFGPVGK